MSRRVSKQFGSTPASTERRVSTSSIQVFRRMDAILTVLEERDEPVALRDIAALTGLNKATVHRILTTLIELRLIERGPIPATYQLGIRAFQLGARVQRRLNVRTRALPHLERLNRMSEETTFLCVRHNFTALCIERLEGKHIAWMRLKLGGALPLHAGAASRVFLAALSLEELEEYLGHTLERFTAKTITDPDLLRADAELTRRRGYAWSDEDVTDGLCAIGAPVFDIQEQVVAAVSISGVRSRFSEPRRSELIRLVREVARDISLDLGFLPSSTSLWMLEAPG